MNRKTWSSSLAGLIGLSLLLSMGQSSQAERSEMLLQTKSNVEDSTPAPEPVPEAGHYLMTPERRALLNTIRFAEGTWKDGKDLGYRTLYGGGMFKDLSWHPEQIVVRRYSSAAAGAYQFMPSTWSSVASELKLPNFEPHHQDQAALHLVKKRGALTEIDANGLTASAMERLAPEWASFPTRSGASAYGQPVKSHAELAGFYLNNLEQLRKGA